MVKFIISVIIPIYNVNKYIEECIESIISNQNVELVCVDDGSKENTDFIVEKYKSYSNFSFYKKENGGLSSARNYGLHKAKGEYIIFLDGDDKLDAKEFYDFIQYLEKTKDEVYIFSYTEFNEIENKKSEKHEWLVMNGKQDGERMLELFSKQSLLMVAWRYCIRKDFIFQNSLLFEEGIYHEDEEWTPRLLISLKSLHLYPKSIYLYRTNREGSITYQVKEKNLVDLFFTIRKMENLYLRLDKLSYRNFIFSRINSLIQTNMYRYSDLQNKSKLLRKEFKEVVSFLIKHKFSLSFNQKILYKGIYFCGIDMMLPIYKYWKSL